GTPAPAGGQPLRGGKAPPLPLPALPPGQRALASGQLRVQFLRGLRLLARDRILLALLVCQPLLIGLLINLSQLRPDGPEPIHLFAVVAAIWQGLNNAAREVVRDRAVYARERAVAVRWECYLGAKVLLFALV